MGRTVSKFIIVLVPLLLIVGLVRVAYIGGYSDTFLPSHPETWFKIMSTFHFESKLVDFAHTLTKYLVDLFDFSNSAWADNFGKAIYETFAKVFLIMVIGPVWGIMIAIAYLGVGLSWIAQFLTFFLSIMTDWSYFEDSTTEAVSALINAYSPSLSPHGV